VLRTAALTGDRAYFDALIAAVKGNPDRRERADLYGALSGFRAPELAQAVLELWLSPEHDIREIMAATRTRGRSEALREGLFNFITNNFSLLEKKLPKDAPARFPQMFAGACTVQQAQQIESFFTPLVSKFDGMAKSLEQSLEVVRLCAHYREAQHASLQSYLKLY
jgi:alanyl aminopeptidase